MEDRRSFCQGYMDGRYSRFRRANDGQCRWVGGRCAVRDELVKMGDAHFNPPYAFGYQAGWEDAERDPDRMGDSTFVGMAMEQAFCDHKLWEVF